MTRDEAIKIFKDRPIGSDWCGDWVDRFVTLGMLKLDEPKSARTKFADALLAMGYHPDRSTVKDALLAFDAAHS